METKAFPSKITMLQDLEKRVEGLDVNTSAFAPRFSFTTSKGDSFLCPDVVTFVQEFNKAFGNILDINGCRTVAGGRGKCILTFLEKVEKVVEKPKAVPKTTKPKAVPKTKKAVPVKAKDTEEK